MQGDRRSALRASDRKSSSSARFCLSSCRIHLMPQRTLDTGLGAREGIVNVKGQWVQTSNA